MRWLIGWCSLFVALGLFARPAAGQVASDARLTAPDGAEVVIDRDDYGVPHIFSRTETGVFYGQGFAVAQDRLFQLETFRRAALGRLAEIDPSQAASDRLVRTLFYTEAERAAQLSALRPDAQTMIESFAAGINAYLELAERDPATYLPIQFNPALGGLPRPERWTSTQVVAVIQLFMRRFGQYGGEELARLMELQTYGPEWFAERRPVNDPEAPTTLSGAPAGEPTGGVAAGLQRAASGEVRRGAAPFYAGPPVRREVAQEIMRKSALRHREGYVPAGLGSFAVLISREKSYSKSALLLGAPQLASPPTPPKDVVPGLGDVSRAWEVELAAPNFHAAGMTIPGIPSVIIGRNDRYAWSLTSGNSDNTDTYVETITGAEGGLPTSYLYAGEDRPFEVRQETIYVLGQGAETFPVLRSVHGPVIAVDLTGPTPLAFSWRMTFWNRELEMAEAFLDIQRGESHAQFEQALREVPMSFNVFLATRSKKMGYWHVGSYPIRPAGTDPRLPLDGRGTQEWQGFKPFEELPAGEAQDYFVNWNNKPAPDWDQGDNVPWLALEDPQVLPTLDEVETVQRTLRVNLIDAFVGPKASFSFSDLKDVPQAIGSYGTYTQALELGARSVAAANLIPPGESGHVSWTGQPSPHMFDQFPLYVQDEFKDMLFAGPGERARQLAPGQARGPHRSLAEPSSELAYQLLPGAPNPARQSVRIVFEVPEAQHVRLEVYDLLGRRVQTLVDGPVETGRHQVDFGVSGLPSGTYFYRVSTPTFAKSRLLTVAR